MSDPYRITGPDRKPSRAGGNAAARAVLWVVLVLCLAGNAVTSLTGTSMLLAAGLGIVVVVCATLLVVLHLRGRR